MRRSAQKPDGARFYVPSQAGANINNVGRDLYVGERSRSAAIGRVVAALGLGLIFVALGLLAMVGVDVYDQPPTSSQLGSLDVPGPWPEAAGLLVTGIVLNRFGRLFAGR